MAARFSSANKTKIGVIQFPGSNCDEDCMSALERHFSVSAVEIWHDAAALPAVDGIIFPGGFSYGDYLRAGTLAAHARVMPAVREFVSRGGPVLGICNGFQILTEARMLPGMLLRNSGQSFICKQVRLRVGEGKSVYQQKIAAGTVLAMPIAHGEGRYHASVDTLRELEDQGSIVFRYVDADGAASEVANPNGSASNIAGIAIGKVMGLMPHPERATEAWTAHGADGIRVLQAFLDQL